MKRPDSKDNLFTRPTINFSPAEQSGQEQMSTPSKRYRLTKDDAVAYLKQVKDSFQDNKEKYDHFLEILNDFHEAKRVDTAGVILRVKELFTGHRHLILGFNTFLPQGCEITLPVEGEPLQRRKEVEPLRAISFVRKIKTRFEDQDNVYIDFLDIMKFLETGDMPTAEACREVSVLLHGHTDLLEEFMHFLPDALVADYVQYNQLGKDHILHHDSRISPMVNARSMSAERNIHHPDSDKWDCIEKGNEKREDCDRNESEHDGNMDNTTKSARTDHYVTDQVYQGMQDLVSSLRDKVKEKLQDPEINKKISDCLHSYMRKIFTSSEFHMLVASLLGNHADLMKACKNFLYYVEKTGCLEDGKIIARFLKAEERDASDRVRDVTHKVNECYDRESDLCGRDLSFFPRDVCGRRMSLCASKEKFTFKPVHKLDLSKCESCTPSYRRLQKIFQMHHPILSASYRTEIGAKVLNDCWVCMTSGSGDKLFKHMHKNQYEQCEDYRFELDMLLESVNATIKSVEELLPSINAATSTTGSSFCIEDHLTALNLRCIERLYGDHGLDVMDVLRKNAPLALPVILIRLRQKQEEWARFRSDFNKVWLEVYAKDYHKSLDHQSFYFKQQDAKLIAEALLAEIKEMSETNHNEDAMLLSIGAGYRQPIRHHMVFEYSDPEIHGDLYQVIKYSCGEICTPEHHDKIMTTWTTFLESFLGVPNQPRSAADTNYVKDNDHVTKSEASLGEANGCPADESGSGNCKSLDALKHEDKSIPTEKTLSSGVHMVIDNNGIRSDGSPNADQVAYESNVITQVQTGVSVLDQDLQSNIEVGLLIEPSATALGPYVANADCGIETMPITESQVAKPFMVKIPMAFEGEERNSQIFYGNDSFYLLLRFHQMMYERMHFAKLLSSSENTGRISNDSIPTDPYARFKDVLCFLLNGSSNNSKFEDDCRATICPQCNILFTLDKLIHKLIEQQQTIVSEETDNKLRQLYAHERSRNPNEFSDDVYHQNACFLLPDDNLYRIECFPSPTRLSLQLMRNELDRVEVAPESSKRPVVFLQRNITKCTIGDESDDFHRSMEGLIMYDGLESKVNCNTMKVSYIFGSEDFMFRTRRRRKALYQKSLCNGASNGNGHERKRKLMFS